VDEHKYSECEAYGSSKASALFFVGHGPSYDGENRLECDGPLSDVSKEKTCTVYVHSYKSYKSGD